MNFYWEHFYRDHGVLTGILAQGEAGPQDVASGDAGGSGSGGFPPSFLFLLGAMFLVFYFLMIRPERRRQKVRDAMLGRVKKGDTVVTTAGIIGRVHRVEEKEVVLQVDRDSNTRLRFLKSSINEVVTDDSSSDKKSGKKSGRNGTAETSPETTRSN